MYCLIKIIRMRFLGLLFWILIANTLYAQQEDALLRHKAQLSARPGGTITEFKIPDPKTEGSIYLLEDWTLADVTLKNGLELKSYFIRYDLQNHLLEIKTDEKVKVIDESKVKVFKWLNGKNAQREEYLNGSSFRLEGGVLLGFFKVESQGKLRLLSYTNLKLQKSNYVPALNSGEKNNKLIKKASLYVEKDKSLFKVPKSRKTFLGLEIFEGKSNELLKFIKNNNLSIKQKSDLIKILKFSSGLED